MPHKSQLSDLLVNVGKNIRQIRRSKEITQQALSEDSGIDRAIISRIENLDYSNITICTLVKLSMALECSMCDLLEKC